MQWVSYKKVQHCTHDMKKKLHNQALDYDPSTKCVVLTKHCNTMYSRLTMNFLNYFKCFYDIKTGFPAKTNRCTLFNCFFYYNLLHGQNRQVTSHLKYVPFCEWFELKLGMCGEEGLLTNFSKFHGNRATSTIFLQHCHKTYQTDPVFVRFRKIDFD